MIIGLKTPYKTALDIFRVPLVGPFVFLIVACIPTPCAFIINHVFHLTTDYAIEQVTFIMMSLWNLLLSFAIKIKISIFFMPCSLAFAVMGALKYFQVIS